ncbi:MAG: type IX secretion system sortase PorU [Breznakibacter sp.]
MAKQLNWLVCAFFFICVPVGLMSQIKITKTLHWDVPTLADVEGRQVVRLNLLDGSAYDSTMTIPLVCVDALLSDWDQNEESITVSIVDSKWGVVAKDEDEFLQTKTFHEQVRYHIQFENKRPVIKIGILPIRHNDTLDVFEKALEISVQIKYEKGQINPMKNTAVSFVPQSVLAEGKWVKVSIDNSGIYKIPYSKLSSWGFSNPENVKVYGSGGKMLPRKNSENTVDDLVENAVWHQNSAIYFYGQGVVEWAYNSTKGMFTHKLHDYTDKTYYFLTEGGSGLKVQTVQTSDLTSNYETSEFDDFAFYEEEKNNLLKSGSRWLGERLGTSAASIYNMEFEFPNVVTSKSGRISTEIVARSGNASSFGVFVNGGTSPLQTISVSSVSLSASEGAAAREGRATTNFVPTDDRTRLTVQYAYSNSSSSGYIDKVDIQVRRQLKVVSPQMSFRDRQSVGSGNVTKFNLELASESMSVWDVTSTSVPQVITLQGTGNSKWFNSETTVLKEFIAFDPSGSIPTPEFVENVANQNLHGLPQTDYLIVTVPKFLPYAKELAAIHETYSGLTTAVVTQNQVFNEFSSGNPDVTAIRSFVRMFYERAGSNTSLMPRYLLLFGDGSYNNRDAMKNDKVLTFQSDNSIDHTGTYVSDDYFGFLDVAEGGSILNESVDIGIGRLPAATEKEASVLVAKSLSYIKSQSSSNWRNKVTFVADDGDSNEHMRQADVLAKKVAFNHPEFNLDKIYFDAYPLVITSSGSRYPDVNLLVEKTFANGSAIFNYTGHGGWNGLSAERIITNETIVKQTNYDRLPLWVTATCEFSCYDQDETSAGELVLLNSKGGGIGLLTTTRVVYSNQNFEINNQFFNYALQKDESGLPLRFGDIVKLTKRSTSGSVNKLNFTLLGDPALRLASPSLGVEVTSINNKAVTEADSDTLKALSVCEVEGMVVGIDGEKRIDFNGSATITVYDKASDVTTLGNNGASKFEYSAYENVLFSGKVKVVNGEFTALFKLPQDLRYDIGNGRISVFATNDTVHAAGFYDKVLIGGIADAEADSEGPRISLWLNSTDFVNGAKVGTTPLLLADIFDENGINTSNTGIGHDIVLTIDEGNTARYTINNYFEAKLDSYKEGTIQYQLPELTSGEHTLTLRVWDTYNNSSSATITFVVENSSKLGVRKYNIYPVPVKSGGTIRFSAEHDDPNSAIEARCRLVTIGGVTVRNQQQTLYSSGTITNEMEIKAVADNGRPLERGIYLLDVDLLSETGKKSRLSQKIMVAE